MAMIPRNEAPAGSPPILSQKGYRQLVVYCVVGSWCDSSKYECFKHSQLQWICVPSLCETIQKTSGASNKNQCVFVSTHQRIHEQIRLESMTRPTSFDRRVRPLSIKGQYTPICTHNVSTQTLSYRTILILIEIWNLKSETWNLKSEIWNLKSEIWNLKPETWNLKSEIWNLKPEIWNLKSEIWNLKSETWSLKSEIWNLESEIWNLKSEIWNLTSEIWNLKSEMRNLKSEIWNLKSAIWNLKSEIWNLKSDICNLKSEIWNLKSEIWNLRSENWNLGV